MEDEKLSRLEAIFKVANEGYATAKEVATIALQIVSTIAEVIRGVMVRIDDLEESHTTRIVALSERADTIEASITRERLEIDQALKDIELTPGEPGKDSDPEEVAALVLERVKIPQPKDGSPDSPEQIRDKLEMLKPGTRLDAAFIDGLKELIETIAPKNQGVRVIGGRAGIQMYIDGAKVGLVQYLNLLAGTGITFDYLNKNGVLTLTVNSSGGASGTWYLGEQITLDVDNKSFELLHAPTAKLELMLDRQPQIYGLDFTGTIDGANKDFAFVDAVDPSLLTNIYANYL